MRSIIDNPIVASNAQVKMFGDSTISWNFETTNAEMKYVATKDIGNSKLPF
jgi:hypothetical protein